jgi:hypothetical protein
MVEHNEVFPVCEVKFEQLSQHLEESPGVRDMVTKHEIKIKILCSDVDGIKKWILGSSASIIITIILAVLGLAVTWGRTLEKVERLDRSHAELIQK